MSSISTNPRDWVWDRIRQACDDVGFDKSKVVWWWSRRGVIALFSTESLQHLALSVFRLTRFLTHAILVKEEDFEEIVVRMNGQLSVMADGGYGWWGMFGCGAGGQCDKHGKPCSCDESCNCDDCTKDTEKPPPDGCKCRKCGTFYPMAVPDGVFDDGMRTCSGCKQ